MKAIAACRNGIRRSWRFLVALPNPARIVFFCSLYIALLWALPDPDTFVVLEARAESIEYTVANSSMASFNVAGMSLTTDEKAQYRPCLTGLVKPATNANIRYSRFENRPMIIEVEPGDTGTQATHIETAAATFNVASPIVLEENTACDGAGMPRFPVWGPAQIGEQFHAATRVGGEPPFIMLAGTLKLYGRSMHLPFMPSGLYHVLTLELPGGARVLSDSSLPVGQRQWWGSVFTDGDYGWRVALSTEALRVLVLPPGARSRPDVIRIGLFARATSDPAIIGLQALLLALFFIYRNAGHGVASGNQGRS